MVFLFSREHTGSVMARDKLAFMPPPPDLAASFMPARLIFIKLSNASKQASLILRTSVEARGAVTRKTEI